MKLALLLLLLAPGQAAAGGNEFPEDQDEAEARLFATMQLHSGLTVPRGSGLSIKPGQEAKAMQAVQEQLARDTTDLTPVVERLERLRARYAGLGDLSAAESERAELRKSVLAAGRRFEEQLDLFEKILQVRISNEFEKIRTKGLRPTILNDIQTAAGVGRAGGNARGFHLRMRAALAEEEQAYRERKRMLAEDHERRRALRLAAAAAGAGLLLFAGAGAWLVLRKKRDRAGPPGPGAVIGGSYRLERELGRGGMGIVFEATDISLRRKVAIKQLRSELRQNPQDLQAFLAEARLVAALKHPNIVEIYAIVNEPGLHLVFELVAGRPLSLELQRAGRLQPDAVFALARQVGSALDYAHANKILHKDLKPANVMITSQGTAKVMDFGLAQRASQTVARLTQAKTRGTPPYMAPEQELGQVSAASDLYSLGVMIYEALTGKLPFPGPNYLAQKRELRPVPPSEAVPGLPKSFDPALARALDCDPEKRFRCATEFVQELAPPP